MKKMKDNICTFTNAKINESLQVYVPQMNIVPQMNKNVKNCKNQVFADYTENPLCTNDFGEKVPHYI